MTDRTLIKMICMVLCK